MAGKGYRQIALDEYGETCCYCGFAHKEIVEVAHLDQQRSNNEIDNLAVLCPTCHKMHDIGIIPTKVVRLMRDRDKNVDWGRRMKDAGAKAGKTRRRRSAAKKAAKKRKENQAANRVETHHEGENAKKTFTGKAASKPPEKNSKPATKNASSRSEAAKKSWEKRRANSVKK